MRSRAIHLLATERHADAALGEGRRATTWRAFLRQIVASSRPAPETPGHARRGATPEMTHLATSLALDSLQEVLQWASGRALVGTLDEALGALRRAGVDVLALRRSRHVRADVLARFLERTDALLARAGLFDDRAMGWVAAQCIDAMAQEDLPAAAVIDGLFEWDASTFAWVESLARRLPVTVRMPRFASLRVFPSASGETSELARSPDGLLSELEGRWQDLPAAPELELFDVSLPASVSLVEGATGAAEARAIAGVIREALGAGASAEEIAVVLPSLDEEFLEPLRAALGEARIAFSEPRGRPPIAAPAVRAALGWLDLSVTLHRDELIDLLRSNAVDPAPFIDGKTLESRRRRALALAARLARVPVGTDPDRTLLLQVLSAEMDARSEDIWMIDALERILSALGDLAEPVPRATFVAKLVGAWDSMRLGEAASHALAAFLASEPSSRQAQVLSGLVREEAVGMRALVEAAHRVEEAATQLGDSDTVLTASIIRSELEASLTGAAPQGTRRAGAVRIVRIADVARLATDLLIVARTSEGAFEPPGDSSVLADDFGATLPAARRPLPLRLRAAAAHTELLCSMAAARRLVITRSHADADGRACAPAPLFSELRELHQVIKEPASALHPASSVLSERAAELIDLGQGRDPGDPDVARRVAIERERLAFFFDPRVPAGPVTGAVADLGHTVHDRLREAFGGTKAKPIAATAIERAALCRFAAFATRVLGASTSDTVGEGLEPWQRGSLIHRALQAAFEAARPHWSVASRAEIEILAAAAARKAILREKSSPLFRAEVERALRDVAAVVGWSLDDESDFVFAHGERSFGVVPVEKGRAARGDEPWPALAIGEGSSTIFVTGRIDRVDTSRDGARVRVIDYKTGALPAWKDVGTRLFQPPLYAYAVLRQMGRLSLTELRALYLDTTKRPPRMLPADDKQVMSTDKIAEAQARAAALVSKLWRGDVAPRPADAMVCGRCDVRDICRRPAAMPVEELEQEGDGSNA